MTRKTFQPGFHPDTYNVVVRTEREQLVQGEDGTYHRIRTIESYPNDDYVKAVSCMGKSTTYDFVFTTTMGTYFLFESPGTIKLVFHVADDNVHDVIDYNARYPVATQLLHDVLEDMQANQITE